MDHLATAEFHLAEHLARPRLRLDANGGRVICHFLSGPNDAGRLLLTLRELRRAPAAAPTG
jgi:hypothetical protein